MDSEDSDTQSQHLIADLDRRKIEKDTVRTALCNCGYPEWGLKEGELLDKKQVRKEEEKRQHPEQEGEKRQPKAQAVLPYMKGLTERLQRAYRKHNVNLYSKAGFIVRSVVISRKDPLDTEEQCGVIYKCECDVC